MTRMACNISTIDWQAAQKAQFYHDENYHLDISRLPIKQRLFHLTLHFSKYAGRLNNYPDHDEAIKIAVDTLIIAVSCANTLGHDVSKHFNFSEEDITQYEFARRLSVITGDLANACEKIDHLENFHFREEITKQVNEILILTYRFIHKNKLDPISEMELRLDAVKTKSIFHEKRQMDLQKLESAKLDNHYHPTEESISEDDLRLIFDDVYMLASKNKSTNLGAALVNSLKGEDRIRYFNMEVLPIYEDHKFPRLGKPPFSKFLETLRRNWNRLKKGEEVDYSDPANARSILMGTK